MNQPSRADWTPAWVARGDNSFTESPFVLAVPLALAIMGKLLILGFIVEAVVRHNVSSSATTRLDGKGVDLENKSRFAEMGKWVYLRGR